MTKEELEKKYLQIPLEMKQTRRWICYNIEKDNTTGEEKKVPINPMVGNYASSISASTWSTFNVAVLGCLKYNCVGLGFMLGEDKLNGTNYFGIDIDNHADKVTGQKALNPDQFFDLSNEFVSALDSYTEYSHSGEGIHIICKGNLPEGQRRRKDCPIEMYDKARFFTMTGKTINNAPVSDRTQEIVPLWKKYLYNEKKEEFINQKGITINNDGSVQFGFANRYENYSELGNNKLSDNEIIERIKNSQSGRDFIALYNGDMSSCNNDHSLADLRLCSILAFWTACDENQIDRIFRTSALMRPKWDTLRGNKTYGNIQIADACRSQRDVYTPPKEKVIIPIKTQPISQATDIVEINEENDPVIKVKQIFKNYSLTDTGNAERFYDYFGDYFRFNSDNQKFMFWNGKTWTRDDKSFIKKYADKMIDIFAAEITHTKNQIEEAQKKGEDGKAEVGYLTNVLKAQQDNLKRVSNKAGKDAMISELQHLHKMPVLNNEFDKQDNYLNTDSGVVNLDNGEILPFSRDFKLSKNTNVKVSYETPTTWIKFLNDIFERPNKDETQELIDTVQLALGESLTGRNNKEHLYILYGYGSNGKSTFIKTVNNIFGDYSQTMNSSILLQSQNATSQSTEFALSSLLGSRMVSMSETAEGKKLDEVTIKQMLSGERITAQFKYGQQFSFEPTFSPWMSTNNKPVIRATDYGTWRRIFFFPFLNTFTDDKKDVDMPKKLAAEYPQILGWMIQGAIKLKEQKGIINKPKCLEEALASYKGEMDVIRSYINTRCIDFSGYKTSATALYQDYKDWAKSGSEYLMSETKFRNELPKRGYVLKKDTNSGWVFVGLKLNTDHKGHIFGKE